MTPRAGARRGSGPRRRDDQRDWPVKHTTSYGGVVVRPGHEGFEVALVRPRSDDPTKEAIWALPKGMKEEGEDPETAACREVLEETGLEAEIIGEIEAITYWYAWAPERVRYRKTVRFFLMRHAGGEPNADGYEIAEVRFVPLAGAADQASYPSERKVLTQAAEIANQLES